LGARIEFANGFHGVAEEFDAHGALRLWRKNVDDAAAHGELAGEIHHFGARVADSAEVLDEGFVGEFGIFGENLREG
jgi:hypothetical protein